MAFKISTECRNAQVDGIFSVLDDGELELRSGTQPASINDAATGTLLSTLTLQNPAGVTATNGVGAATLPVNTVAMVTGIIGWGRLKTSVGTTIMDGTVSLSGGGGDIITSVISVSVDDVVQLISLTFTAPAL